MPLTTGTEQERLARIEERLYAMGDDITEMKTSLKEATTIMSQMHVSYVPRTEIDKMAAIRDKEKDEMDRRVNQVETRVNRLEAWRNYLAGGIAVVVTLGITLFEYGRQWIAGGVH